MVMEAAAVEVEEFEDVDDLADVKTPFVSPEDYINEAERVFIISEDGAVYPDLPFPEIIPHQSRLPDSWVRRGAMEPE